MCHLDLVLVVFTSFSFNSIKFSPSFPDVTATQQWFILFYYVILFGKGIFQNRLFTAFLCP